jgi:nicotinamide riboside transporter PnuC
MFKLLDVNNVAFTLMGYPMSYVELFGTLFYLWSVWLMARRRIESWLYWIVVDVIGIWLYYVKEVKFVSLLYVILLGLAVSGFISWTKSNDECGVMNDG